MSDVLLQFDTRWPQRPNFSIFDTRCKN